jgi:gliding motility-associated protein GldM
MSIPKETRQIMINLMYLVLTALLALNVSNEILHAFKVINESIQKSNASIESKNKDLYEAISENEKMAGKYEKVHPYKVRADEVKAQADAMVKYLENWKERIITESGGKDDKGEIKREDNIDASTLLLVERNGGDTLKDKIQQLRNFLISKVDDQDQKIIEPQLSLKIDQPKKSDNNPQGEWKVAYFHNMPTMAVLTLLAKFQNDVRNSEALVINKLFEEAHSKDLKFDAIQAIAVPKTSYALAGQKVEAQIMLAAYNKTIQPTVTASSGKVNPAKDGVATWETVASGVGLQTVKGTVSLNMGDHMETKPYEFQYMVGSTGASMQLDKMNVFYIGVPNPVTISAAGYSVQDVSLSIPGATITPKEPGHYDVAIDKAGTVTADIMANDKANGGVKKVGSMEVRVKYIPDPVAEVGGKSSGALRSDIFKAQLGVVAQLKNFDFDARFVVTSFSFSMLPKRGEYIGPFNVKGPLFKSSAQVMQAIERTHPGDKIFIEDIKAIGPDKHPRNLSSIVLSLN